MASTGGPRHVKATLASPKLRDRRLRFLGPFHHVMKKRDRCGQERQQKADRFREPLPRGIRHRNLRIGWKAAVQFRIRDVVQHVDDVRAADRGGS